MDIIKFVVGVEIGLYNTILLLLLLQSALQPLVGFGLLYNTIE